MTDTADAGEIRDARLADALGERYLAYALSTIMSRSLPDVRDGLAALALALVEAALPEREPHARLHAALLDLLRSLERDDWALRYVAWN